MTSEEKIKTTFGNKLWRLQNLYKINSKYTGVAPFRFKKIQRLIYKDILDHKPIRYLVIKHRQALVSTFFLIYWLDECLFTPNYTVGILAHKWESLKYLFGIIRFAYDSMPDNIKPKLRKSTETTLEFEGLNSKIFVSLEIRSVGLNALHISEWCLCEDENVIASLAAVGPQGDVTGESTANGLGDHGYNTYQDGKLGLNRYKIRFLPWWLNDFYQMPLNGMQPPTLTEEEQRLPIKLTPEQILFRREAKRQYQYLFDQEMAENDDACFLTSGGAYFNNKKIHALFKSAKLWRSQNKPYQETDDYIAFEQPNPMWKYAAGADTAEGLRTGDYSALKIINVSKGREAFAYRARVGVDKFSQICDYWCRQYGNATLAPESNNHGHAVIELLLNLYRYPNVWRQSANEKVVGFDKKPPKWGWETTAKNKAEILDMLKFAVEGNYDDDENHFDPEILFLDQIFLQECLTFLDNNGKYEAAEGKYDDTVMATAIAYQMYRKMKIYIIQTRTFDGGSAGIITGLPREAPI